MRLEILLKLHWKAAARRDTAEIAVPQEDRDSLSLAQPPGGLDQRFQYGFKLKSRPADDLQDIGGGSLLFQGLGQLTGPRLHFVDQTHVLDGDHGLVGEG